MIKRYILHLEFHRGYRPRISFRKAPQHGDRTMNGGELGTLVLCPECQDGFLHRPDIDPRLMVRFPDAISDEPEPPLSYSPTVP